MVEFGPSDCEAAYSLESICLEGRVISYFKQHPDLNKVYLIGSPKL